MSTETETTDTQAPDTGEWSLSAAMVNEIIYRDHFASSGMKPVCIDIPEPGGKRVHYAAVIVCVGKETAERILTDRNAVSKLVAAIEAEAARRAFNTGLGVSEWESFLWPEARAVLVSLGLIQ